VEDGALAVVDLGVDDSFFVLALLEQIAVFCPESLTLNQPGKLFDPLLELLIGLLHVGGAVGLDAVLPFDLLHPRVLTRPLLAMVLRGVCFFVGFTQLVQLVLTSLGLLHLARWFPLVILLDFASQLPRYGQFPPGFADGRYHVLQRVASIWLLVLFVVDSELAVARVDVEGQREGGVVVQLLHIIFTDKRT